MRMRILLVLLFFVPVFTQSSDDCVHDSKNFRCVRYLKNYDGDTITFKIPDVHPLLGDKIPIRVRSLDTPELRGTSPCEKDAGRIAKRLIESLLKNAARIDLINVERDKYFRILADVIYDGKNLKDILFKNQLAYPYEGGAKEKINWCEKLSLRPQK